MAQCGPKLSSTERRPKPKLHQLHSVKLFGGSQLISQPMCVTSARQLLRFVQWPPQVEHAEAAGSASRQVGVPIIQTIVFNTVHESSRRLQRGSVRRCTATTTCNRSCGMGSIGFWFRKLRSPHSLQSLVPKASSCNSCPPNRHVVSHSPCSSCQNPGPSRFQTPQAWYQDSGRSKCWRCRRQQLSAFADHTCPCFPCRGTAPDLRSLSGTPRRELGTRLHQGRGLSAAPLEHKRMLLGCWKLQV